MRLVNRKKLYEEIAKELGLSVDIVHTVVSEQFRFVMMHILRGTAKTIRLPYFGSFKPHKKWDKMVERGFAKLSTPEEVVEGNSSTFKKFFKAEEILNGPEQKLTAPGNQSSEKSD